MLYLYRIFCSELVQALSLCHIRPLSVALFSLILLSLHYLMFLPEFWMKWKLLNFRNLGLIQQIQTCSKLSELARKLLLQDAYATQFRPQGWGDKHLGSCVYGYRSEDTQEYFILLVNLIWQWWLHVYILEKRERIQSVW